MNSNEVANLEKLQARIRELDAERERLCNEINSIIMHGSPYERYKVQPARPKSYEA